MINVNDKEIPLIVLSTRWHNHLGTIKNVDPDSIELNLNMNSAQELSFDVYKNVDGVVCDKWEQIIDSKLCYVPSINEYFEITVSTDESSSTVKHVTGKSACEAELSQRLLRNFECNTESDISRDDYVITKFYNPKVPDGSLLHRVLSDKCQDYSIGDVDETLWNIQRTFSADNTDVYSFLTSDVAEEIGCLFKFNSVHRKISVHDLKCNCFNCGNRGEWIDECPKCGSRNVNYGYGKKTNVFISAENFADSITVDGEYDSVKNCFKIEGGDDLITATVSNINPNGSSYIYRLADFMQSDMPTALIKRIHSYNDLYNSLIDTYTNYTEKLYEAIDNELYYQSLMMPEITIPITDAATELKKVTVELSKTGVAVDNMNISKSSVDLAVKGMAKVLVSANYDVDIISSSVEEVSGKKKKWTGKIKVKNVGDEENDVASSDSDFIVYIIGDNYEQFVRQKIQKQLDKTDSAFNEIFNIEDLKEFKIALKDYCLDSLLGFESAYQSCIEVLIQQGVTSENKKVYGVDLYNKMYKPYCNRLKSIQNEEKIREATVQKYIKEQNNYESKRNKIQKQLDFQAYIGKENWLIFNSYIREDTYSNDNYISEGLNNSELIKKANELFNVANDELYKASELQVSLSSTLNNLLLLDEFKDFKQYIDIGNFIIVKVDEKLYRLRLINIGIKYGNLDKITVSFANAVKIKNYITDTKSVLEQANSMASTYNYVAHQASQGNDANSIISKYETSGLDAAKYNIINGDNQNIIIDEHGISCREFNDIENKYSPEQIRIINNLIAYTDDNWNTVRSAIGKIRYSINGTNYEKYGMNADAVIAGVMIGGSIFSENYKDNNEGKNGTHINLNDGTFSFGGGKLTFDGKELKVHVDVGEFNGIVRANPGSSFEGKIDVIDGTVAGFTVSDKKLSYSNSKSNYEMTIGVDKINNRKTNYYTTIENGSLFTNNAQIDGGVAKLDKLTVDNLIVKDITGGFPYWIGTNDEYEKIEDKDSDTFYFVETEGDSRFTFENKSYQFNPTYLIESIVNTSFEKGE